MAKKKKNSLSLITTLAKKIRMDNEKWMDAVKRATKELKTLGKIG